MIVVEVVRVEVLRLFEGTPHFNIPRLVSLSLNISSCSAGGISCGVLLP